MGFLSGLGRAVEALGLRLQGRREGARGQALPAARFREKMIEALDDPQFARQAARRLALPILPIRGGQCTSANNISSGSFGASCGPDAGNYNFASGGKVGIGTTSPGANLQVDSGSLAESADRGVMSSQYSSDAAAGLFVGRKARGTQASPAAVGSGDYLTAIMAEGFTSSGFTQPAFSGFRVDGTVSAGSVPAAFVVNTGTSGTGAERMRVTSGGNVGIGTAAPQQALTLGQGLNFATLMATPGAPTLNAGTGGSLAAGTYYYKITALDANGGQTLGGGEASVTVGASGSVTVSWTAVPGASQYRVWRGTGSGGENFYNLATGTSYTDLGGGTSGTLPITNTASGLELTSGGVSWFPYQPCVVPGGGFGFLPEGQPNPATVLYRAGQGISPAPTEGEDIIILRTYTNSYYAPEKKYAILKIWAPPGAFVNDREATLTLSRGDNDEEYVDVYNNGYSTETQYGIRMAKSATGQFRDFVFDQQDSTQSPPSKTPVMILKASRNVGIGTTTPQTLLDIAGQARVLPVAFSALPSPGSSIEGAIAAVTDSTVSAWGAHITGGGGSNHVLAYCDGTNWTVIGV